MKEKRDDTRMEQLHAHADRMAANCRRIYGNFLTYLDYGKEMQAKYKVIDRVLCQLYKDMILEYPIPGSYRVLKDVYLGANMRIYCVLSGDTEIDPTHILSHLPVVVERKYYSILNAEVIIHDNDIDDPQLMAANLEAYKDWRLPE